MVFLIENDVNDGLERRMVGLDHVINTPDLAKFRASYIVAVNHFAQTIWLQSILEKLPSGKDLDRLMLPIQSSFKRILNSVWAEKARITDVRYGVVDKAQRKSQDRFVSWFDGRAMQADLHAALTIAL